MADFPISKSQSRLLSLLNLTANDYTDAAQQLQARGFEADGIPAGHDWRSAKKLSDAELLATSERWVATDDGAVRNTTVDVTRRVALTAAERRDIEARQVNRMFGGEREGMSALDDLR